MKYFVRVSCPYEQIAGFFTACPADQLVCYEHDASRVHCHFYIVTDLKSDAIKVRLKKFGQFTKSDWSFKTAQDDGCIRYMAKGKYDAKYVRGYSTSDIDAFKADWKLDTPSQKKKTQTSAYDLAQEVAQVMKENSLIYDDNNYDKYISDIMFHAVRVHHKYRKAFCEFSLRRVITTAMSLDVGGFSVVERKIQNYFSKS